MDKILIGRKDVGDFPELGLKAVGLKVDTGAFTSTLHCRNLRHRKRGVVEVLEMDLSEYFPEGTNKRIVWKKGFDTKVIKSSNGHSEERFIILTTINLFGKSFPIRLSLSDRTHMKTPVLLGRKFLVGKFIVDPAKWNLSSSSNKKKGAA